MVTVSGTNVRTLARLKETLAWRTSFLCEGAAEPLTPHCKWCADDSCSHFFFSLGKDKRGWELLYCCPARTRSKDPNGQLWHSTRSHGSS